MDLKGVSVVWAPTIGPQTDLLSCPCFEVFFGGARGGGKTDGMLGDFASHAQSYGVDAIGMMVRRSRKELEETIERSKQIYLPLGATYNETKSMWTFPNGARLRFAYLERDSDADAYQGHNYTRVYIEEAGTFPSEKPILKLMATLRSGAGVPVGIRLTGNPGGPGQGWVKARYIDPAPQGYEVFEREFDDFAGGKVKRDWVFIPSFLENNPYLGPNYVANLQMVGSDELVKAWLKGDWTVVMGAFFSEWRMARHVVAPFDVPDDWLRFRSMDWGSASPFSIGWWAIAGDETIVGGVVIPRGCMVRYREWYGASGPNEGLKLTIEQIGEGIKDREDEHETKRIAYGVLDPKSFATEGGPSHAERFSNMGIYWRPADNKRVARMGAIGGWDQMRARLHGDAQGNPMLVVFNTCKDFIRTIPTLQHDPERQEDVDTESEDHVADEARYACMSRPFVKDHLPKDKPKRDRWNFDDEPSDVTYQTV